MILPEDAWQKLLPYCTPRPAQTVDRRAAAGRVLAEGVAATVDVPFADVSAMDGYALAGALRTDRDYAVVETIAAGSLPQFTLAAGDVARIMTGAIVPGGADRVVPVEQTSGGSDSVSFQDITPAGAHIRRQAEIHAIGDPLLPAGTLMTPGTLGLLATHGISQVQAIGAPKVAILTTGDEVVPPDRTPAPGQLRDSHTPFLTAAISSMGLESTCLGIAPDEPEQLREFISRGLDHDLLLLGGGVSMGEFDFVEGVLAGLQAEILFDSVSVQPGKPLVGATIGDTLVIGLPGNPASVMACFWLFARPAIRRMMGLDDGFWQGALPRHTDRATPFRQGS